MESKEERRKKHKEYREKKVISDDYFNHPSNMRKLTKELNEEAMAETNFPANEMKFANNN